MNRLISTLSYRSNSQLCIFTLRLLFIGICSCLMSCSLTESETTDRETASTQPAVRETAQTPSSSPYTLTDTQASTLGLTSRSDLLQRYGKPFKWHLWESGERATCSLSQVCEQRGECATAILSETIDSEMVDRICVAANRGACLKSKRCQRGGSCTPKDGRCVIDSDLDCFQSTRCKIYGACSAQGRGCVATKEEHCTQSVACRDLHACFLRLNLCVNQEEATPKCEYGCVRSISGCFCHPNPPVIKLPKRVTPACLTSCEQNGECYLGDEGCVPRSQTDCETSQRCKSEGVCHFEAGQCVISDRGCAASLACSLTGRCTLIKDRCEATTQDDCSTSRACAELEACHFELDTHSADREADRQLTQPKTDILPKDQLEPPPTIGSCIRPTLPLDCTESCKLSGKCEAIGDQCLAVSTRRCQRAEVCKKYGLCTAVRGRCLANSVRDCKKGQNCKRFGYCTPVNGQCKKRK